MSSLFFAPLGAIRFMLFHARSISLALLLCLTNSTYADNFCAADVQAEALLPDLGFVADWGIRVNRLSAKDYNWQDVVVQQRSEIEYEQDVRVTYDQEAVSFTSFWQDCESFIGKQELCESDESLSMVINPNQLNESLLTQGSLVNNSSNNITSFSAPHEGMWQVSENPILEEIFNISMTDSEIDALGDFTQLGIRQAIRVTVDVNQTLDFFDFNEKQLPFHIVTSRNGLFVESKIIIKALFISGDYSEQPYVPYRTFIEGNYLHTNCNDNTCSYEYLLNDLYDLKWIVNTYPEWSTKNAMCSKGSVLGHTIAAGLSYPYTDIKKVLFHYEIQTSIVNSNNIDNFNPLDYMDRDLTLPPRNDAGSLYYLLLIFALIARLRKVHVNHS